MRSSHHFMNPILKDETSLKQPSGCQSETITQPYGKTDSIDVETSAKQPETHPNREIYNVLRQ